VHHHVECNAAVCEGVVRVISFCRKRVSVSRKDGAVEEKKRQRREDMNEGVMDGIGTVK